MLHLGIQDLPSGSNLRLDPPAVNKPTAIATITTRHGITTMNLPIPVDLDIMKQIGDDDDVIEDAVSAITLPCKRSFEIGVMKRGQRIVG